MKKLFGVAPEVLGDGKVTFEWSPKGNYLAAAGSKVRKPAQNNLFRALGGGWVDQGRGSEQTTDVGVSLRPQRRVNIYDRNGRIYDEIHFPAAEYPNPDSRACGCASMQVRP
jgi:WD repeat-containing protein 19